MKRIVASLLSATMILGLGACSSSGSVEISQAGGTVELTLDSGLTPTHIINKCGEALVDLVNEKTNGEVQITFYPADTLGNSSERVAMLMGGETDISMQALSAFDSYNPRQGVVNAFFMFNDWDHYQKYMESDIYGEVMSGLEEATGATVLGEVYYNRRHIVSKKPVQSLADLKGLKFRVPNEPMPIASIEALGASPTPMAGNEVYMALQNGTIDATENGAEQIVAQAFYEVAPYMTFTAHQYQTQLFVLSDAGRQKLSDEQFELLCEAVDEVTAEYNTLIQESEAEYEEQLRSQISCYDIDTSEFRTACEAMYDQHDDEWGDGTWEAIRALAE